MGKVRRGISAAAVLVLLLSVAWAGTPASAAEDPLGSISGVWLEAGQVPADPSSDISLSVTAADPDSTTPEIPCDIDPSDAHFLCSDVPAGQYWLRGHVDFFLGETSRGRFGAPDGGPITVAPGLGTTGVVIDWGIISGTYTSGGEALPRYGWVKAKAYDAATGALVAEEYRRGGSHGLDQFRLRVAPGTYRVHFDTLDRNLMEDEWGKMWESQWYPGVPDQSQAQIVTVAAGAAIEMNPDLRPLTSFHGLDMLGREIEALDLAGRVIGQGRGDAWGSWVITDLPLGSYKLRWRDFPDEGFDPPWNWFYQGSDFPTAHVLTLHTPGQHLLVRGPTVPTAPQQVRLSAGQRSVAVAWEQPARDGGRAVTSFTAHADPGGQSCTTSDRSCEIAGLTPDTEYQITVVASNELGSSHPSEGVRVRTLALAIPPQVPGQETPPPTPQGPGEQSPQPGPQEPTTGGSNPQVLNQGSSLAVGAPAVLPPSVTFHTGRARDGSLRAVVAGVLAAPGTTVVLHWCNVRVSGRACDPLRPSKMRGSTSKITTDGRVKLSLSARKCRVGSAKCAATWGKTRTRRGDRVRIVAVVQLPGGRSTATAPAQVRL